MSQLNVLEADFIQLEKKSSQIYITNIDDRICLKNNKGKYGVMNWGNFKYN